MFRYSLFCLLCISCLQADTVTVIGVGRLGLCLALYLEKAGYEVLGVDTGPDYVRQLNDKTLCSPEPGVNELLRSSQNFRATLSLDEGLDFSDLCFIVVPTNPPSVPGQYDCAGLDQLLDTINERKVGGKHIVIVSTLFPGYIRNKALQKLQDCPGTVVSYNPEFIAQGAILQGIDAPELILIGEASKQKGDELEILYKKLSSNNPYFARMSPESAEIMKLSLNCFVTMKIAFANLVGDIADDTPGADKFSILKALGYDSRIGSRCLFPGYGFGGPCFPRDNRALGDYADLLRISPVLFRSTDLANRLHAQHMAEQFLKMNLDQYVFEDVCYKSRCPVPIIEESQKLAVAKLIAESGKTVVIIDRSDVIQQVRAEYGEVFQYVVE